MQRYLGRPQSCVHDKLKFSWRERRCWKKNWQRFDQQQEEGRKIARKCSEFGHGCVKLADSTKTQIAEMNKKVNYSITAWVRSQKRFAASPNSALFLKRKWQLKCQKQPLDTPFTCTFLVSAEIISFLYKAEVKLTWLDSSVKVW